MDHDVFYLYHRGEHRFPDLSLCYCGYEKCRPLHSFGPAVRPNYLLHVILRGSGIFRTEQEHYALSAGDGFLIEPHTQTFYQADAEDPWTYLWVGFDGRLCPELMKQLGLGGRKCTFHTKRTEELKGIVREMLRANRFSARNALILEGQLYLFFATLIGEIEIAMPSGPSEENLYVQAARTYIRNHFQEEVRVDEIASYVGVTRNYLYTLFRRETGAGPQEYLRNFRLSRAADLLDRSDCQIEVIARSSGYRDPRVFSKAFRARYGMTPTEYRKRGQMAHARLRETEEEIGVNI